MDETEMRQPTGMRIKSSKYKGVSWDKKRKGWLVRVELKGRVYRVGVFDDEEEAARAYNDKRIKLQGNHAKMNELSDLVYCPECKTDLPKENFYPSNSGKNVKGIYGVCKKCHIKYSARNTTTLVARYKEYMHRHFRVYGTTKEGINKLAIAQRMIKLIGRGEITIERGQQIFNGVTNRKSAIRAFAEKLE